ncbi:MAG: FkbM family methyltransferase [Verrucomicrobia bacterium]|nr:FkbM family methyltransferase [Verrucomicrobiota bacterium]
MSINIPGIMASLPEMMRRHRIVKLILTLFPDAENQWIKFNESADAFVNLRDPEVRNVFLKRSFEPNFFKIAAALLSDGGVYFDCGANFGLCTFGLLPLVDVGRLFCHMFEANPVLIPYLEKSCSAYPAVFTRIVHGCLSDRAGFSPFQRCPEYTGHSHVTAAGDDLIQNVVLDDYVQQNGIEKIRFIKMDIEGQELNALRGFSRSLADGLIDSIYFELASDVLEPYGLAPNHVTEFLDNQGYDLFAPQAGANKRSSQDTLVLFRGEPRELTLARYCPAPEPIRTDLLAIHRSLVTESLSSPNI